MNNPNLSARTQLVHALQNLLEIYQESTDDTDSPAVRDGLSAIAAAEKERLNESASASLRAAATDARDFLASLLGMQPAEAIDALTNNGERVEDALIAALTAERVAPVASAPHPLTARLIAAASAAYPDDLIADTYDAARNWVKRGAVGDTLAEFVAIEIKDLAQGETSTEDAAGFCADALERAGSELAKVAEALRDLQADSAPDPERFDRDGLTQWLKDAGATGDNLDPDAYRLAVGDSVIRELGYLS